MHFHICEQEPLTHRHLKTGLFCVNPEGVRGRGQFEHRDGTDHLNAKLTVLYGAASSGHDVGVQRSMEPFKAAGRWTTPYSLVELLALHRLS